MDKERSWGGCGSKQNQRLKALELVLWERKQLIHDKNFVVGQGPSTQENILNSRLALFT